MKPASPIHQRGEEEFRNGSHEFNEIMNVARMGLLGSRLLSFQPSLPELVPGGVTPMSD